MINKIKPVALSFLIHSMIVYFVFYKFGITGINILLDFWIFFLLPVILLSILFQSINDKNRKIKRLEEQSSIYRKSLSIIAGIQYHSSLTTPHEIADLTLRNLPLPKGALPNPYN
jgi:hypothetical protein